METLNYQTNRDGVLVASGEGVATVTAIGRMGWLLGDSDSTAPTKAVRHTMLNGESVSMNLAAGEHLWLFGTYIAAVTAENPAAGDI